MNSFPALKFSIPPSLFFYPSVLSHPSPSLKLAHLQLDAISLSLFPAQTYSLSLPLSHSYKPLAPSNNFSVPFVLLIVSTESTFLLFSTSQTSQTLSCLAKDPVSPSPWSSPPIWPKSLERRRPPEPSVLSNFGPTWRSTTSKTLRTSSSSPPMPRCQRSSVRTGWGRLPCPSSSRLTFHPPPKLATNSDLQSISFYNYNVNHKYFSGLIFSFNLYDR